VPDVASVFVRTTPCVCLFFTEPQPRTTLFYTGLDIKKEVVIVFATDATGLGTVLVHSDKFTKVLSAICFKSNPLAGLFIIIFVFKVWIVLTMCRCVLYLCDTR